MVNVSQMTQPRCALIGHPVNQTAFVSETPEQKVLSDVGRWHCWCCAGPAVFPQAAIHRCLSVCLSRLACESSSTGGHEPPSPENGLGPWKRQPACDSPPRSLCCRVLLLCRQENRLAVPDSLQRLCIRSSSHESTLVIPLPRSIWHTSLGRYLALFGHAASGQLNGCSRLPFEPLRFIAVAHTRTW